MIDTRLYFDNVNKPKYLSCEEKNFGSKRTNPAAKDQVICDKRTGNEEQYEKDSWFNLVTINSLIKIHYQT